MLNISIDFFHSLIEISIRFPFTHYKQTNKKKLNQKHSPPTTLIFDFVFYLMIYTIFFPLCNDFFHFPKNQTPCIHISKNQKQKSEWQSNRRIFQQKTKKKWNNTQQHFESKSKIDTKQLIYIIYMKWMKCTRHNILNAKTGRLPLAICSSQYVNCGRLSAHLWLSRWSFAHWWLLRK